MKNPSIHLFTYSSKNLFIHPFIIHDLLLCTIRWDKFKGGLQRSQTLPDSTEEPDNTTPPKPAKPPLPPPPKTTPSYKSGPKPKPSRPPPPKRAATVSEGPVSGKLKLTISLKWTPKNHRIYLSIKRVLNAKYLYYMYLYYMYLL